MGEFTALAPARAQVMMLWVFETPPVDVPISDTRRNARSRSGIVDRLGG